MERRSRTVSLDQALHAALSGLPLAALHRDSDTDGRHVAIGNFEVQIVCSMRENCTVLAICQPIDHQLS